MNLVQIFLLNYGSIAEVSCAALDVQNFPLNTHGYTLLEAYTVTDQGEEIERYDGSSPVRVGEHLKFKCPEGQAFSVEDIPFL